MTNKIGECSLIHFFFKNHSADIFFEIKFLSVIKFEIKFDSMNRKLLQDQPLKLDYDDLESVNYLEKQDKKVSYQLQHSSYSFSATRFGRKTS